MAFKFARTGGCFTFPEENTSASNSVDLWQQGILDGQGLTLPSFAYLNGGDFHVDGGVELNGLGAASPAR